MTKETTTKMKSITDSPTCLTCKYHQITDSPQVCAYPVPEWVMTALQELLPDRARTLNVMYNDEGHTCTAWEQDASKPFPFGTPHFHADGTHGFGCHGLARMPSTDKKPVIPGYYWREFRGMSAMVFITNRFLVQEFGSAVQQSMDCFPNAVWKFVKIKK